MYRYYFNDDKKTVYCVSTYAGKVVKGRASCADEDEYVAFNGAELAKARCDVKVAEKRVKNANKKYKEAEIAFRAAEKRLSKMNSYVKDSKAELTENKKILNRLLKSM